MSWLLSRRQLLKAGMVGLAGAALPGCLEFEGSRPPPFPPDLPETTPWPAANAILKGVVAPAFRDARFPVSDFGARGDGRTDDTAAFQQAIVACNQSGGGHVTVLAGTWVVGALRLLSDVDLTLSAGATLLFSADPKKYPPVLTRYEGIECLNSSPMIYAYGATNVALTGEGTLDASRTATWNRGSDRAGVLDPMVARGLPPAERVVTGRLCSSFVEPYRCANVLIQGVTLLGARFWQIHPTLCTNVLVDGVTTRVSGANTDGCNPESCDRVVIRRCTFGSGDDNIVSAARTPYFRRSARGRTLAA